MDKYTSNDFQLKISDLNEVVELLMELRKRPKIKEIKCNSQFLPQLLHGVQMHKLPDHEFSHMGYLGLFNGVPLIIDDTVETYEPVFYDMEEK